MASALLAKAELTLGPSDYPVEALRSKRSAAAIIDAFVDPKGRIVTCEVAKSFGDPLLSSQICSLLKNRKHKPAGDPTGQATYGWVLELNTMWVPDSKMGDEISKMSWKATVPLKLDSLPSDAGTGPVEVLYQVGPDGQPTACAAGKHERRSQAVSSVCALLKPRFGVKADRDGHAVSYVTQLFVDIGQRVPAPPSATQ
jgi:hypothetical protein